MKYDVSLSEAISSWIDKSKRRTLRMLSQKSEEHYSTVRRAATGASDTSIEVALSLAPILFEETEAREKFLAHNYPRYAKYRKDNEFIEHPALVDAQPFLTSKLHALVIALAGRESCGVRREDIEALGGKLALDATEELISNQVLKEVDGTYFTTEETFRVMNPKLVLEQVALWASEIFDVETLSKNKETSHYGFFTEGLNELGEKDVYELFEQVQFKLNAIYNDPAKRGTKLVYAGFMSSFYDVLRGGK